MTTRHVGRTLAGAALVGAVALAGCGGDSDYKNELRPARVKVVSVYVSNDSVSISPRHLGGGPITLVVTNQAGTPQTVTLESAGSGAGTTRSTGQIDPGDNQTVKAVVQTGAYKVSASSSDIRRAVLLVGRQRPSAQGDLQLP